MGKGDFLKSPGFWGLIIKVLKAIGVLKEKDRDAER